MFLYELPAIDGSGRAFAVGVGYALLEVLELGVKLLNSSRGGLSRELYGLDY
jgi:hypothetical protein